MKTFPDFSSPTKPAQRITFNDKSIMVVDDDPLQVQTILRVLRSTGCHLAGSTNPNSFLRWLSINNPDLVILDVMMPDIDGWEVFRRMRASPRHQNTPVIFLTGIAAPDEEDFFNLGPGNCRLLAKPVHHEGLLDTIEELLTTAAAA
ncbi:MAG: response regulator [Verrucomicrobiae bacterium]|nr:response regulator [Verrucomicrobiae bacterium]